MKLFQNKNKNFNARVHLKIVLEIIQRVLLPFWKPRGTWGPVLYKILTVGIGVT